MVIVSGEVYFNEVFEIDGVDEKFEAAAIDYYGEFKGGYPWICKKLEEYAEDNNGFWEWENPACVIFVRN